MRLRPWPPLAWTPWAAFVLLLACGQPPSPASSPGSASSQPPPSPRRVTVAVMSEPPVLNHLVSRAFSAVSVAGVVELEQLVNDGMVVSNDRGMLQPRLAEAVPTVENGLWRVFADGRMETTWKIKPAARWHDGTPFLAQDLLFTMKVAADRQVGVFRNTMYDLIESAQAVDDRTVLMRWKSPSIEADTMFTHDVASPMPSHLLGAAFAEDPANLVHHPYWSSQFVGTGAFQLKDWVMGSHLVLKAREAYILGRPRIDEIEVKFIPDTNTMVANVLAGTVALTLGRSVALQEALDVRERSPDTNVLLSFTTWAVMYPQFLHPNPPIIADVRFRRALLHAIDRQEMADTIQQGMVTGRPHVLQPRGAGVPSG